MFPALCYHTMKYTEKIDSVSLPFFLPLIISPTFLHVPIFAGPTCFCYPASRRAYRCHRQLFGPSVTHTQRKTDCHSISCEYSQSQEDDSWWFRWPWPPSHQNLHFHKKWKKYNDQIGITLLRKLPQRMTSFHFGYCMNFIVGSPTTYF